MNELIKEAIEMLDNVAYWDGCPDDYIKRIDALKETLAKPEHEEPVGKVKNRDGVFHITMFSDELLKDGDQLYTTPQSVRRLRREDIKRIFDLFSCEVEDNMGIDTWAITEDDLNMFTSAIQDKLQQETKGE